MRRKNDAAGVAGPMFAVQRGVIFRQQRVAAIFKNRLDEIQIAHEIARHKKADFHRFLFSEARDFGTNHRTDEQRDKTFRRLRLRGRERQFQQFARRRERVLENFGERNFRHAQLVVGNRQAAFADMENSGGGAAVTFRIVQNALFDAVGIDDVRRKIIAIKRQREHARESRAIQRERVRGQFGRGHILQIIVEKRLDARVGGAKMRAEQPVFFARLRGHRGGDLDEFAVALERHGRTADQGEFDIDVGDEMRRQLAVHGKCVRLFRPGGPNPLSQFCWRNGLWQRFFRRAKLVTASGIAPVA